MRRLLFNFLKIFLFVTGILISKAEAQKAFEFFICLSPI
jgi:hypothetical protein